MHSLDVDLEAGIRGLRIRCADRLRSVESPWYVLAGWALDLFLGRQTRTHDDVEIGVPADRFPEIRHALRDLELVVVGDGRAWPLSDEALRVHRQTWVRESRGPWRLDVIRERWEGEDWIYRRDARIRMPGSELIALSDEGIPYVQPEVALLFKAKATRPKDEHDFDSAVLPALDRRRRDMASRTPSTLVHPGHRWLDALTRD